MTATHVAHLETIRNQLVEARRNKSTEVAEMVQEDGYIPEGMVREIVEFQRLIESIDAMIVDEHRLLQDADRTQSKTFRGTVQVSGEY